MDQQEFFVFLLRETAKAGASDLHIIANVPPALRLHGEIAVLNVPALTPTQLRNLIYGLLNSHQIEKLETDLELCFSRSFDNLGRFRITVYFHAASPELSIRRCADHIPAREELGLPDFVDQLPERRQGLMLFTGPTGMGKTTSMHCLIDMINSSRRCKIVTIEDPVEYVHHKKKSLIVQQEMRADVRSFGAALRHVLRQDPDVICVGEMRDLETIETALVAAETGHFVIATLHTPNAAGTIDRIVSVFPAMQQNQIITQLANALQGVITQLLLPRADKRGRVLAAEVLIVNTAVRNCIRERQIHQIDSVIQTSKRAGMQSMDASLFDLYERGDITIDTALAHTRDSQLFNSRKADLIRN